METTLVENSELETLEKLILRRHSSVGQVKHLFDNRKPIIHETKIAGLLLSFLGGEKMLENSKSQRGLIGDVYDTDIYNNVALIFDHLVQKGGLWLSDIHRFMDTATVQLKAYGDEHHVYAGICQFGYQMLVKMYVSILRHVEMQPASRLHILGLLCNSLFHDACDMRWNLHEFIADQYLLITEEILQPTNEQRKRLQDKSFLWFWDHKKI